MNLRKDKDGREEKFGAVCLGIEVKRKGKRKDTEL